MIYINDKCIRTIFSVLSSKETRNNVNFQPELASHMTYGSVEYSAGVLGAAGGKLYT